MAINELIYWLGTTQGAFPRVEQLRGVSYDLKMNGKHEIGVIAEEVGAVVPEVVSWNNNGKDADGVDYSRLTALLIDATKEQQALIHKQQQQLYAQQAQIEKLAIQVKSIQASLKTNERSGTGARTVKAQVDRRKRSRGLAWPLRDGFSRLLQTRPPAR